MKSRQHENGRGNSQSYVIFSDFLITTALDNYLAETADLLGEQAGSSIDLVVRNIITSGTNVARKGSAASYRDVGMRTVSDTEKAYSRKARVTRAKQERSVQVHRLSETGSRPEQATGGTNGKPLEARGTETTCPELVCQFCNKYRRFVGGVGSRGAVTASSILSAAEMRRALRALKRTNARPFPELNGNYAFLIHPMHLGLSFVRTIETRGELGGPLAS